jgi:uncharacterized protein
VTPARRPRAAVFDLDGLLVDTHACWQAAFAAADDGAERALPAGLSVADAASELGVPAAEVERLLLEQAQLLEPGPMPGGPELLALLRRWLPLAVASNGPRSVVEHLLVRLELLPFFDAVVTADDVAAAKPAPDVYLEACRRLGVEASEVVAFEDSPIGVEAARAAGTFVIGVPADGDGLPEAHLVVRGLDDSGIVSAMDVPSETELALIERTAAHVRAEMDGEGSGHDWWHVRRVWTTARLLCESEHADRAVVELAALLHDLADWKFHDGDLDAGPRAARAWLESVDAPADVVDRVCDVVARVSFKGAGVPDEMDTIEGRIVQDADRLDALGAVGIARAFAYGGHVGQLLHDPELEPAFHADADAYLNTPGTTVNHFHEKLLQLRDRMHTDSGRRIAAQRHAYMESFLEQFLAEWDGADLRAAHP